MNIDSEVVAALAALPPFPAEFGSDVVAQRAATRRLLQGRPLVAEAGFERQDREVPGQGAQPPVAIRLYRPTRGIAPHPAMLFFHRGGFTLGDLDAEDATCARLCTEVSCLVVSVDYRLAPENRYPAAIDDGYAALQWVAGHASELGIDASRLAVAGGSAGGGLAAGIALLARDRGETKLCFQLLLYPAIDDRMDNESSQLVGVPIFDGPAKRICWEHYLGAGRTSVPIYAAPNRCEDLSDLPPTYLLTAEFDPLRDEGLAYAMRLIRYGVPVEFHHFSGVPHGWDIFSPTASATVRSWDDRIATLRRAFR